MKKATLQNPQKTAEFRTTSLAKWALLDSNQ